MIIKLKKVIKWLLVIISLIIIFILLSNLWVYFSSKNHIYSLNNAPESDFGIILGARVMANDNLSQVLQDRVDTAIELYELGKIKKILISGDNATIYYNEVIPVKNYLLNHNIPLSVIFLDYAGFDTYDSMYRADYIFSIESALVITQNFHLPRSVFLCKHNNINCNGVIADKYTYVQSRYFRLREFFANVKAVLNVIFHSDPKFFGPKIYESNASE